MPETERKKARRVVHSLGEAEFVQQFGIANHQADTDQDILHCFVVHRKLQVGEPCTFVENMVYAILGYQL